MDNTIRRIIEKYSTRSDYEGYKAIATNYLLLMLYSFLIYKGRQLDWFPFIVIYLPLSVLVSSRLRGFENLVHEASHCNLFNTTAKNTCLMHEILFAFPVFKSLEKYKESHVKHHTHFGNVQMDPDMMYLDRFGLLGNAHNKSVHSFVKMVILKPFELKPHIDNLKGVFEFSHGSILRTVWVFFHFLCFSFSFIFGVYDMLFIYYIPFFLILPIIRFWCEVSEHLGTNHNKEIADSRNNIGLMNNYVFHLFNDGYHAIHHMENYRGNRVPFYQLKTCHNELMQYSEKYVQDVVNCNSIIESVTSMYKMETFLKHVMLRILPIYFLRNL